MIFMYDGAKIIPGLIIFVVLATFAIWYGAGDAKQVPKPEKPVGYTNCVKPTQEMKESHMSLLNEWRTRLSAKERENRLKPVARCMRKACRTGVCIAITTRKSSVMYVTPMRL